MNTLRGLTILFLDPTGNYIFEIIEEKQLYFGRAELNQMILVGENIEPFHARIFIDSCDMIKIQNFSDRYPILVNGRLVVDCVPLHDSDIVTIGSACFVVQFGERQKLYHTHRHF